MKQDQKRIKKKRKKKKEKNYAETRDYSGLIRTLRFEPGTFRSSVWRSPNWAISAFLNKEGYL